MAIQSFLTRSEPFGTINIKEKTRGLISMHHMRYRAGLRVTYRDTVPNKNSIILFLIIEFEFHARKSSVYSAKLRKKLIKIRVQEIDRNNARSRH